MAQTRKTIGKSIEMLEKIPKQCNSKPNKLTKDITREMAGGILPNMEVLL